MSVSAYSRSNIVSALAALLVSANLGCKQLPGTPKAQGAVIGGAGGAAAGAAVAGQNNRLLGALIGGAVGAGGGYLIGANSDRITGNDRAGADQATKNAQAKPATPQQALNSRTADLNGDGFVTMDEVVAMRRAGLSDQEMVSKLQATGQVFELTSAQKDYLRSNGVDPYLISEMEQINKTTRDRLLNEQGTAPTPAPASPTTPVPPPPGP